MKPLYTVTATKPNGLHDSCKTKYPFDMAATYFKLGFTDVQCTPVDFTSPPVDVRTAKPIPGPNSTACDDQETPDDFPTSGPEDGPCVMDFVVPAHPLTSDAIKAHCKEFPTTREEWPARDGVFDDYAGPDKDDTAEIRESMLKITTPLTPTLYNAENPAGVHVPLLASTGYYHRETTIPVTSDDGKTWRDIPIESMDGKTWKPAGGYLKRPESVSELASRNDHNWPDLSLRDCLILLFAFIGIVATVYKLVQLIGGGK